jgi:hypothetical protein
MGKTNLISIDTWNEREDRIAKLEAALREIAGLKLGVEIGKPDEDPAEECETKFVLARSIAQHALA